MSEQPIVEQPEKGKDTFVDEIPDCDFDSPEEQAKATVDGATIFGYWANMCNFHWLQYGRGLGTGVGQRLHPLAEKPEGWE
jgi:hypothetical protein